MTKHLENTNPINVKKPILREVYCEVHWYTGDITKEKILSEDENFYYFDSNINGSYLAKKEDCTLL